MAISTIDVGSTANDGTGDTVRAAFQTTNTLITAFNNGVDVETGFTRFKDDAGTLGVTVTDADIVGIGTAAPNRLLHLRETSTGITGSLRIQNDGTGDSSIATTNGAGTWIFGHDQSTDIWGVQKNSGLNSGVFFSIDSSGDASFIGGLNAANLPTSSAGLSSGDIWNDSGTLKIV